MALCRKRITSPTENTAIKNVSLGAPILGITFDSANDETYVANENQSAVSVIGGKPGSPTENKVIGKIGVGPSPIDVLYDSNTKNILVSNYGDNSTSIIDGKPGSPTENKVIGTLKNAVSFPNDYVLNLDTGLTYKTNPALGTVSVISNIPQLNCRPDAFAFNQTLSTKQNMPIIINLTGIDKNYDANFQ